MENASKALLIAVGILLGIMTLSLLVYVLSATERMQQAQDEKKVQEELAAFNNTFEAYHKSRMYGTDVISLVNKAIENNNKMDVKTSGEKYYINVKITVNQDFKTIAYKVEKIDEDKKKNPINDNDIIEIFGVTTDSITTVLESDRTYELGEWQKNISDGGNNFITNKDFCNFFKGKDKDYIETDEKYIYYLYSALTNFKRAIFSSDVTYNEELGRIKEITVEQINI